MRINKLVYLKYSTSVQSLSRVWLFATPWTAACQAWLSITNSQSLCKLMSIHSVKPSTILFSVVPFSSCLQSFPRSESFPVSSLFESDGQSVGASASTGTKYHILAGIDNRNKFSHSSVARSLSADLVSSEASFLGLQMAAFLSCPHKVFPLCVCMPLLSLFMSNFFVEGHQPDWFRAHPNDPILT